MQNLDPLPEVAEKIVLAVEIACASSTKLAGTEFLITEKLGIPLNEVAEMRYREGEYPGEFTVKTPTGAESHCPSSKSSMSSNVIRRTGVSSAETGGLVSPTSRFLTAIPTSMPAARAGQSRLGNPS